MKFALSRALINYLGPVHDYFANPAGFVVK